MFRFAHPLIDASGGRSPSRGLGGGNEPRAFRSGPSLLSGARTLAGNQTRESLPYAPRALRACYADEHKKGGPDVSPPTKNTFLDEINQGRPGSWLTPP